MIEDKFSSEVAESLILRLAGFSFFNEKSEKMAISYLKKFKAGSIKDILSALVIAGIKNLDDFDINALAEASNCSVYEINNIFKRKEGLSYNLLPVVLSKENYEKRMIYLRFQIKNNVRKNKNYKTLLDIYSLWLKNKWLILKIL